MSEKRYLGQMYLAKVPECGHVIAAGWLDADITVFGSMAKHAKDGFTVEIVDRYDGDPMPKWCDVHCAGWPKK